MLARGPQFAEALVLADVDVAASGPQPAGDASADALDGTTMTIRRIELREAAGPPPAAGERPEAAAMQQRTCPGGSGHG